MADDAPSASISTGGAGADKCAGDGGEDGGNPVTSEDSPLEGKDIHQNAANEAEDASTKSSSGDVGEGDSKTLAPGAEGGPCDEESEEGGDSSSSDEDEDDAYIAPIRDAREVTFATCRLNPHIVCRLCQGYFRDPHTIVECLHTFCKSCLLIHFAQGHSTCPHCNAALGQRPIDGIRADRTLETLVEKLFPHFRAAEEEEEAKFCEDHDLPNPKRSASASAASVPKKRQRATDQSLDMSFKLVPDDERDATRNAYGDLDKPFLRTSKKLRVIHLKKYLAKKLKMDQTSDIEISCNGETLGEELSLEFIARTRWHDDSKDLVLNYRRRTLNY